MTDDPINRIEAALEAGPTPGPWHHEEWGSRILDSGVGSSQLLIAQVAVNSFRDQGRHNARFITACNPVAIRALLDRLKAAEADRRAEYWKAEHLAGNTEIERLSAETERLRADAERYRWLRDHGVTYVICAYEKSGDAEHDWSMWLPLDTRETDDAIDAAMKVKK